jgi:cleavage and polyadenylation specificity factor subunit 2
MGRIVCLEEAQDWRAEVAVRVDDEKGLKTDARPQVVENGMEGIVESNDKNHQSEDNEEKNSDDGKRPVVTPLKGPFVCTIDEINEAFNSVKSVRYSQPIVLSGMPFPYPHSPLPSLPIPLTYPLFSLTRCTSGVLSHLLLTPYSSGHTLGGTVFKIRSPTSGTILYAVGMNHTQERHLDGTVILNPGRCRGLRRRRKVAACLVGGWTRCANF